MKTRRVEYFTGNSVYEIQTQINFFVDRANFHIVDVKVYYANSMHYACVTYEISEFA